MWCKLPVTGAGGREGWRSAMLFTGRCLEMQIETREAAE